MTASQHGVRNTQDIDIEYLLSRLSPELRKVTVLRFSEEELTSEVSPADLALRNGKQRNGFSKRSAPYANCAGFRLSKSLAGTSSVTSPIFCRNQKQTYGWKNYQPKFLINRKQ